jgi:hypothetical protein
MPIVMGSGKVFENEAAIYKAGYFPNQSAIDPFLIDNYEPDLYENLKLQQKIMEDTLDSEGSSVEDSWMNKPSKAPVEQVGLTPAEQNGK